MPTRTRDLEPLRPAIPVASRPAGSLQRPRVLAVALIPLQLFLAAGWLRAGTEKLIDSRWWNADALRGFLAEQRPHMLPWFTWFSDVLVEPLAMLVALVVLAAQLMVGGCLLTNRFVRPALWAGIVLNLAFTMAGRVNPSAFYLVMEITLLFALARAVREPIALRRAIAWLIPATFLLPFARTLHPRDAIDDPALMLVFLCVIASVTTIALAVPLERMVELASTHRLGRVGTAVVGRFVPGSGPNAPSGTAMAGDVVCADGRSSGDRSNLDLGVDE